MSSLERYERKQKRGVESNSIGGAHQSAVSIRIESQRDKKVCKRIKYCVVEHLNCLIFISDIYK